MSEKMKPVLMRPHFNYLLIGLSNAPKVFKAELTPRGWSTIFDGGREVIVPSDFAVVCAIYKDGEEDDPPEIEEVFILHHHRDQSIARKHLCAGCLGEVAFYRHKAPWRWNCDEFLEGNFFTQIDDGDVWGYILGMDIPEYSLETITKVLDIIKCLYGQGKDPFFVHNHKV